MIIRCVLLVSSLLLGSAIQAQSVKGVYKIDDLLKRIGHPDTTYVVNFWATWCKPCIQELPAFDSLYMNTRQAKVKVLLVSLDFKEDLDKKVNPFLAKNHTLPECVLLDESNGNDFINRVHKDWSGAIPATLFKHGDKVSFHERKVKLADLDQAWKAVQ